MKIIKVGSSGVFVRQWQNFLLGQHILNGSVDGNFGHVTQEATMEFQFIHGLEPDGIVGNKTIGMAMTLGFLGVSDEFGDKSSINWPPRPDFKPVTSNRKRQDLFGKFSYRHAPIPSNPERIEVTDNWKTDNIIPIDIPQLRGVVDETTIFFHRLAAGQMQALWKAWEDAGLLHLVLTWAGSYVPRFIRGSTRTLSNHAFGTAFDINVKWNWLGSVPALVGKVGSVRELVMIANDHGFYWGGHYKRRLDGMHFEVAVIK